MRFAKDPLALFLLLGLAVFATLRVFTADAAAAQTRIEVGPQRIEALAASFSAVWKREPTESELRALVDDWVREEVLVREALARELDVGDAVVRKRLRQKLEFVPLDLARGLEPTDAELASYLAEHAERFRHAPRLTLRQVFVDPSKPGEPPTSPAERAAALLEELRGRGPAADVDDLGDGRMLPTVLRNQEPAGIARHFGGSFALAVEALEPGRWQGPVESGYGLHLVIVDEHVPSRQPPLSEVRELVAREWTVAEQEQLSEAFYQALRSRYEVRVQWPGAEDAPER